jgi:hypothetical protein
VNKMAQADFASQLSASQSKSDDVQVRQTQRRVAKAGFFQRARHYLDEAREIAKGFEDEARITGERMLFPALKNSIHPLVTLGALESSAVQDLNFLGTHLSQELMLAEANPLEYMQQSEARMNTASFALTNKVRQFPEMAPYAMGEAGFDATLDAVSFLTPGVGEIKAAEVLRGVGEQILDHSEIQFSQSSVNNVDEITESMKRHGWQGSPIDVVRMSDGGLVTVDNTRLLAASRAKIQVKAMVHEADERLNEELSERFMTKQGGVPQTWEEAVWNRINKQNYLYRSEYPNGSSITGVK